MNKKWKIDIHECSTNNGGCHADAICTNTIGSFTCTCKPEYSGTGFMCNGNDFFFKKKNWANKKLKIIK